MYYDTEKCGARIRQLRKRAEYTQETLSEKLNIDQSFLCRIESGKKGASVDLLMQISALFKVSLDYLLLGTESNEQLDTNRGTQIGEEVDNLISHLQMFKRVVSGKQGKKTTNTATYGDRNVL